MRIGINEVLVSSGANGAQRREVSVLPHLLPAAAERGWDCTVYFSSQIDEATVSRALGPAAAKHDSIRAVRTSVPRLPTALRVVRGHFYWPRRARRDRLDLYHTAYYPVPRVGCPVVLTVHDLRWVQFPETYQTARLQFLRRVIPSSLRRATRIVAVSEYTKQEICESFGIEPAKIDVAYNPLGSEFRRLNDTTALQAAREQLQLPERFILYVGSLEPRKNLPRLLQAYGLARERGQTDSKLVILGRPHFDYAGMIRDAARRFADDVRFTGYVADELLPAVYNLARALAFPSLHEGFGIPVIEAMACGVPVLTSNVTALPEVAGDAALLVDPRCVESISAGLARLEEDEALRTELIERGLRRAECFAPERTAESILKSYERCAESAMLRQAG